MGEAPTAEHLLKEQQKLAEKKAQDMIDRCVPVVYGIFRVISEEKPPLEVKSREEFIKTFEKVTVDCLKLLKESKLTIAEIEYLLPKMEQVVQAIKQQLIMSLNKSSEKVLEKKLGKPHKDLNMDEMDEILVA